MREYVLTLLVTAAVTYMLTPLVRHLAVRFGAFTPARDRDVHVGPIPRMGGLGIYLGVAAGLLVAYEMVPLRDAFPGSGLIFGLLGAGGLIVGIGIIDDRWGMSAIIKLVGQVVAAGILFASGARLYTFPLPNSHVFVLTQNESVVLTILVVVATINAVNFIDGLDGLAAGIVVISAISFFAYYYSLVVLAHLPAMAAPALAAIVLAGGCLGFLPHNFFPARIFMGDTGSMLLGLLLAYVPIQAISQLDWASLSNRANRYAEILPLLLPAVVLVIPYVDMLRAVVRRTRAGMSPLAADKKHLHHRLLEIGHSHRASVLILYAWAAIFSAAVVGLSIVKVQLSVLLWTTLAAILALALLSLPKLRWWARAREAKASHRVAASRDPGHVPTPAPVPVPTFPPPEQAPARGSGRPAGPRLTGTPAANGWHESATWRPDQPANGAGPADQRPASAPRRDRGAGQAGLGLTGPGFTGPGLAEPRPAEPRPAEPRPAEPRPAEPGQIYEWASGEWAPRGGVPRGGAPREGAPRDWGSGSGSERGGMAAAARGTERSADLPPSVYRPVEPTPVHPLEETMPMPVAKPPVRKPPVGEASLWEPAVSDPAASERATRGERAVRERSVWEPVVREPAVREPAGSDPAFGEPGMSEPGMSEPVGGQASGGEPAGRQPAARASGNVIP